MMSIPYAYELMAWNEILGFGTDKQNCTDIIDKYNACKTDDDPELIYLNVDPYIVAFKKQYDGVIFRTPFLI